VLIASFISAFVAIDPSSYMLIGIATPLGAVVYSRCSVDHHGAAL
jgi:hypothetical protein